MDPNECLAEIRDLLDKRMLPPELGDHYVDRYRELASRVEALDVWLRTGGMLPADWLRQRPWLENGK